MDTKRGALFRRSKHCFPRNSQILPQNEFYESEKRKKNEQFRSLGIATRPFFFPLSSFSSKNRINFKKIFFSSIVDRVLGEKNRNGNFPLGAEKYIIRISKVSFVDQQPDEGLNIPSRLAYRCDLYPIEYEVNLISPRFYTLLLSTFSQRIRSNNSNNPCLCSNLL